MTVRAALPETFPPGVAEKLGVYVYALRDPRDQSIFYIGKGRGDRVYSHVWVAMGESQLVEDGVERDSAKVTSAKNKRINEIYDAGEQVQHYILRPNIAPAESPDKQAFQFEQVLISAFRLIERDLDNPVLTNIMGGHTSGEVHRRTDRGDDPTVRGKPGR
ncbi:GIY-YIG nuclease family protein [Williamsia sterculiae]|uniref:GIY-YIG nuclease family protein n=1 Tax=Williamsia sterculiae TaxID=1344003 RepID=UPI0009708F21|nr:GIY-YIG nuclease family protein [Williamsia sterculiae]